MGLPYDLKNTSWDGYDNPYIPTSEVFYSVNFTVGEYTCTSIGIKNMGSPNYYCLVALPENESTYMILYSGSTFSWLYNNPIGFVDGDDIANVDLLHFMYSSFGYLDDMAGSYWTWVSDEAFEDPDGFSGNCEFSAGGTSYVGFYAIDGELTYYPASGGSITAYDSTNGWASDDYKSFIVTDAWSYDEDVQNVLTNYMISAFLPAPDVIISYKGAEIATLSDSGTKTLQTQGKYCEGDITVSYTKSGGGGGSSSPYDVIIQCTNINGFTNNTSDYVWRVGTKSEIIAKMKAGEPISGIAYCKKGSYDDEDDVWSYDTSVLALYNWGYYDYGYGEVEAIVIDFALNNMTIYNAYTMVRRQRLIVNLTNEDPNLPISYVFTDQTMDLKKN